jgi:hypothetical protein
MKLQETCESSKFVANKYAVKKLKKDLERRLGTNIEIMIEVMNDKEIERIFYANSVLSRVL